MNEHQSAKKQIIIVGGGARGLFFTKMLTQDLGREVAAIVDTHVAGHEAIRHRLEVYGVPHIPIYKDVDEAIAEIPRSQADTMFIMTPEWTHMDIFRKAVNNGFHIFLEKPLATTLEDTNEIMALAKKTDQIVQVGFVLRYTAFYQKIKAAVDRNEIGKIMIVQMNERLGLQHGATFKRSWHRLHRYTGGFMNEKCTHDLDLMCWMKEQQSYPVEVTSFGGVSHATDKAPPLNCSDCELECPWRFRDFASDKSINGKAYTDDTFAPHGQCVFHSDSDVNDHQTVNVRFADGTQGVFTAISVSGLPGRDLMLHGTAGYIQGNLETGEITLHRYWDGTTERLDVEGADSHGGGDLAIVGSFLDCIADGVKPLSTVAAGVRAGTIAFAADRSNREGVSVRVEQLV
ncbi:Gfo/Idh/MocA family protein [Cohnella soli]|uniref:Gfo/Idh/MocA family protein n=1 Tax=Cohnella soli TaxID=425005 RepID=A0ABW0HJP0_9BACL